MKTRQVCKERVDEILSSNSSCDLFAPDTVTDTSSISTGLRGAEEAVSAAISAGCLISQESAALRAGIRPTDFLLSGNSADMFAVNGT
jgi:hypothetical protein